MTVFAGGANRSVQLLVSFFPQNSICRYYWLESVLVCFYKHSNCLILIICFNKLCIFWKILHFNIKRLLNIYFLNFKFSFSKVSGYGLASTIFLSFVFFLSKNV